METTKSFKKYLGLFGPHFTKDLCNFAVGMMETEAGPIVPFTKAEIENKLNMFGIKLKHNLMYDFVYVANMCKADFLGNAVPNDDAHLCEYIKHVVDDPDGYDGLIFNRWLSDMKGMNIPIDWSEFV